nr:Bm13401 [Brugia malayi]
MERDGETLTSFNGRILKFLKEILAQGAELITTRDMTIRKKELEPSFMCKKYAKLSGRLITLEIAWNREEIEKSIRMISDIVEVVDDCDFEHHRATLYRFAQMQTDIC